ncbi:MAG: RNA polymerase sigma factor [Chitinispirillaceae bacterium]|nr:RNA polymerase sigma factor [Chitinispirillaceae bacterium]
MTISENASCIIPKDAADLSESPLQRIRTCMIENRAELISVAFRITFDKDAAEDIIQDISLSLCSSSEQFKGLSSPKTYIYRIVINRSIDYLRKIKRSRSLLNNIFFYQQPESSHGDLLETKDLASKVFMKIPEKFRVPLILAEIKELSYEEIAKTLSLPVNTIKTRIFRCREKLRIAYEKLEILP